MVVSESAPLLIADHELIRRIAAGSYGEVWLGRTTMGTLRAVKIVRRDRFENAEDFEREFRGLQRFEPTSRDHDALVDVLQIGRGEAGDWFYYVMELADSSDPAERTAERYEPRTLRSELKRNRALAPEAVIQLGIQLSGALQHLHDCGLVHRDVKPSNILFIRSHAKLADAGLVAPLDDARSLVGTVGYIAPEGPGTPQADVYALGKVLYEAAFGKDRQRFPQLPADLLSHPRHGDLLELNEVISRACAHNPANRHPSARELQTELELLGKGQSIKLRKRRARLYKIAGVCAVAVLLATGAVASLHFLRPADPYLKSANPEVNNLIEQGHNQIRLETTVQFEDALRKFKLAAELDPSFAPAYVGLQHAYFRLGDNDGVHRMTLKLVELAPKSAETLTLLAWEQWQDWHISKAVDLARRASNARAVTREGDTYAHIEYGLFLLFTGKPSEALREFRRAEKILPNDPIVLDHIGSAYLALRDFQQAEKILRESVTLQPDHWNGHYFLVRTYEATKRFDEAIIELKTCDRLQQVPERALEQKYEALTAGWRDGGERGYWNERIEQIQEGFWGAAYDRARFHAWLGEMDRAYELLEKFFPDHGSDFLMSDLCWDREDVRFKKITRQLGLVR